MKAKEKNAAGERRKRGILFQYIISLIALVLLPFFILNIIFMGNGLKQVRSAYRASQEYAMRQAIQNIDNDMRAYRMVAAQITSDSSITPLLLKSGSYDTVLALRKLATYQAQVSFFDSMYLYIDGDNTFYSGSGIVSVENFENRSYSFNSPEDREAFEQYLREGRAFALSTEENGGLLTKAYDTEKYVAVTYPWINSLTHPLGTVIGLVEEEYFTDLLSIAEDDYREGVYLLDRTGKCQFSVENGVALTEENLSELLDAALESGSSTGRVGGISCDVLTGQSSVSGWTFLVVIPGRQFFWKYVRGQNAVVSLISILLCFCIMTGIVVAFWMYRPIRELRIILDEGKDSGTQGEGQPGEAPVRDDWVQLRRLATEVMEKNRHIARELEENRELYRKSILKALLLGAVSSEHVRESMENQNIRLDQKCSCVATLACISNTTEGYIAEAAQAVIEKQEIPGLYILFMENSSCLAMIWNVPEWSEEQKQTLLDLHGLVMRETGQEWIFTVGNVYQDPGSLSSSYMEALAVGESVWDREKADVYYYGEFRRAKENNELYQSILAYVEAHFDDSNISLSELAEQFSLSPSYLSRFFRKCSGKNFLEYVTDKRIEKACVLLRDTDLRVKDITEKVGYLDVASFTRKFRNIMGVSPSRYREQKREFDAAESDND